MNGETTETTVSTTSDTMIHIRVPVLHLVLGHFQEADDTIPLQEDDHLHMVNQRIGSDLQSFELQLI